MAYVISVVLIILSALFSGLTLGLMGLDVHALKRKMKLGNKQAKKVYVVRRRGNLLLTTLLLGNVAVNAALSIFLGTIATGLIAGFIATGLIFLFGEIIPQAIISRYALWFGSKTAWMVRILMVILFPITGPIAWLLDKILGSELPTIFSKSELMSVIEEHEDSAHSEIDEDEERIMIGALTFSNKTVGEIMTPWSVVETVEWGEKITQTLLKRLRTSGFSRFPVLDDGEVVGILYLRELVGRQLKGKFVKGVYRKDIVFVGEDKLLDDTFNLALRKRRHLFVVQNTEATKVGVVTMEDVLEEIVGREIVDEADKVVDMRAQARKKLRK